MSLAFVIAGFTRISGSAIPAAVVQEKVNQEKKAAATAQCG
jgi:hypothetical protein